MPFWWLFIGCRNPFNFVAPQNFTSLILEFSQYHFQHFLVKIFQKTRGLADAHVFYFYWLLHSSLLQIDIISTVWEKQDPHLRLYPRRWFSSRASGPTRTKFLLSVVCSSCGAIPIIIQFVVNMVLLKTWSGLRPSPRLGPWMLHGSFLSRPVRCEMWGTILNGGLFGLHWGSHLGPTMWSSSQL